MLVKRIMTGLFGIVVFLLAVHTKREFVAPGTVIVTGADGRPLANVPLEEEWNAYSYDLNGWANVQTDALGRASLPEQAARHSLLYWYLKPALTALNYGAHASFGTTASIDISGQSTLPRGSTDGTGFFCSDHQCVDHPLAIQIKLKSI